MPVTEQRLGKQDRLSEAGHFGLRLTELKLLLISDVGYVGSGRTKQRVPS